LRTYIIIAILNQKSYPVTFQATFSPTGFFQQVAFGFCYIVEQLAVGEGSLGGGMDDGSGFWIVLGKG